MAQVATFHIGDELFGVDILLTKEIGKLQEITEVPMAPDFFLGLMNLRGQVVTVMDPGVFLDQKCQVAPEERRLIILKNKGELDDLFRNDLIEETSMSRDTLAIVIDRIGDVVEVADEDIRPTPPNLSVVKKEFVSGIIQQQSKLIILLDMGALAKRCIPKEEAVN
ncbi:MAG: chemotaxis protein CheW [bacterium]|nr:chemotaxis protein CheW [bacterium]